MVWFKLGQWDIGVLRRVTESKVASQDAAHALDLTINSELAGIVWPSTVRSECSDFVMMPTMGYILSVSVNTYIRR